MSKTVCVFFGDDAAPEAVRPTVDLLERLDTDLEINRPAIEPHASALDDGDLPDPLREAIDQADTVLFGSASNRHSPIIRYLRFAYRGGLPVNARPARYIPGSRTPLADPRGIDYVILRENLEGLYFRAEGSLSEIAEALPDLRNIADTRLADLGDGAYAIRVMSRRNIQRYADLACEYALGFTDERPVRLTCATKSNVLPRTDGLFESIIEETAAGHDGIAYEHLHADDLGQQLVIHPQRFDVITTPNIAGDLLSDVAAGTIGGLGLAPSGCYGEEGAYFEPVHGTAPDIAGEGIINPTAMVLSAVMMLSYLGYDAPAVRLRGAVEAVYAAGGPLTPDQGGSASTDEMAAAIAAHLEA